MIASQTALNGYAIMWLYVMFDLPTDTKKQRHDAAWFRKELIKDGFVMHQFSVYIRHCMTNEAAAVHVNRIRMMVPAEGFISILKVTDKQFGSAINLMGRKSKPPPKQPIQLELF